MTPRNFFIVDIFHLLLEKLGKQSCLVERIVNVILHNCNDVSLKKKNNILKRLRMMNNVTLVKQLS